MSKLNSETKKELNDITEHVRNKYSATILEICITEFGPVEGLMRFIDALSFVTLGYRIKDEEMKGKLPNAD